LIKSVKALSYFYAHPEVFINAVFVYIFG